MKRLERSVLVCMLLSMQLYSSSTEYSGALFDLYTTFPADNEAALIISGCLRAEFDKTDMFAVVERSEMSDRLKIQRIQYNDTCRSQSCMINAGHLLGVERVLYGSVARNEDIYNVVLRMVNINRGELVCTVMGDVSGDLKQVEVDGISSLVEKMVTTAGEDLAGARKKESEEEKKKSTDSTAKAVKVGYLQVEAVPEEAVILIDGKYAGRGTLESFEVPISKIRVEICAPGYETYSKAVTPVAGETKTIEESLKSLYGSLTVETKPKGVDLFLNDTKTGTTPYKNDRLKTGAYKVTVREKNFQDITEGIAVDPGKTITKSYTLRYNKAYRDSLVRERYVNHGLKGIRKVVFGGLAVLVGATGYYFNWEAQKNKDISVKTYDKYMLATDDHEKYKDDYYAARKQAKIDMDRRNVAYIFAGIFAGGFCISLVF